MRLARNILQLLLTGITVTAIPAPLPRVSNAHNGLSQVSNAFAHPRNSEDSNREELGGSLKPNDDIEPATVPATAPVAKRQDAIADYGDYGEYGSYAGYGDYNFPPDVDVDGPTTVVIVKKPPQTVIVQLSSVAPIPTPVGNGELTTTTTLTTTVYTTLSVPLPTEAPEPTTFRLETFTVTLQS